MQNDLSEIILQTHDDTKVLRMSDLKKFTGGSGYSCNITIRSGGFSCERPFYFDDSHFPDAIEALQKMDAGEPGEAIIKGQWDDDFIKFESNQSGHVIVTGQMQEHSELSQLLKFGFQTDQTVLGPLVRGLSVLLNG